MELMHFVYEQKGYTQFYFQRKITILKGINDSFYLFMQCHL